MLTIPGGIVLVPPDLEPWLLPPDWEVSLGLPLPERLPKRGLPFFWPPPEMLLPWPPACWGGLGAGGEGAALPVEARRAEGGGGAVLKLSSSSSSSFRASR